MSTKELSPGTIATNGRTLDTAFVYQVVLSGAGLVSQGIDIGRINAVALVNVLDEIVLGSLDIVEEWNKFSGQMAQEFGNRPVQIVRKAYTTGTTTIRQLLATL
jgi:hypothetical protein